MQAAHHKQATSCLEEAVLLSPGNLALRLLYAEAHSPPPRPSLFSALLLAVHACVSHTGTLPTVRNDVGRDE